MASYRFLPAARDDLEDVWDYTIARWDVEQAIQYTDEIETACEILCESPLMCRERDEYNPPVRMHPHGEHLIVYVIDDKGILIVRILHSHMDVDKQLTEN